MRMGREITEDTIDASLEEMQIRVLKAEVESLRNSQCQCLPVVEAERDKLREENTVLRKRLAHMRMRITSAAKMLIEDLDEDQLQALLRRIEEAKR